MRAMIEELRKISRNRGPIRSRTARKSYGKEKLLGMYVCIVIFLCTSSPVLAEAGWTDYAPIAELVPTARQYYELRLPVKNNPGGCRENTWFYQDYGLQASDKMFATLLEGLQSRKRVRVYVTGKCNVNGYSEFTAVSIIP